MKTIDRIYGNLNMNWKRVILMALVCGIVPGLLLSVPFLENSSLQNIGVCFEGWIALALIIILNCKKPLEAGLKTFVFFLISQPLIYLVQVPFSWLHWQIFMYYKRWFILTLLTLPGGMAAWYAKKGNLLSVFLLAAADGILLFLEFPGHLRSLLLHFPRQLLAVLFILASSCYYSLHLIRRKGLRALSFALKVLFLATGIVYVFTLYI